MKILTVGGGSGGHVTPVVAIIKELKKQDSAVEIRFWCDRGFANQAKKIVTQAKLDDILVKAIFSGKLRRYHGRTFFQRVGDISTLLKNIRDIFLFVIGFFQSVLGLILWRPQVVFAKGGFVCLPVGLAATVLRIPLVIHDSDTHPGLTNRILSKFANLILTGAPLDNYSYPAKKSHYVGIPIGGEFKPISHEKQQAAKKALGFSTSKPLLLVTGGGLGARNINSSILKIAPSLLKHTSIIHICGVSQYKECKSEAPAGSDYKLLPFVENNIAQLMGAADLVISRAGATTMLELAALGKATIVIPNALLVAGHQVKNAKVYESAGAVKVVDEKGMLDDPGLLKRSIINLLKEDKLREELGSKLHKFSKPEAAKETVELIEKLVASKQGS